MLVCILRHVLPSQIEPTCNAWAWAKYFMDMAKYFMGMAISFYGCGFRFVRYSEAILY